MAEFEGIPMNPNMFDHLIGQSTGVRNMTYTWRDISLYGLGIGAHREDLPYFFERAEGGLKAFPTFAMMPYLNNITMQTVTPEPDGTNEILREHLKHTLGYMPNGLHMAMDVTFDGLLDPYGGTLVSKDRLNGVLDRGEGKGIVADCAMEVWDVAGRHLATLHSYHYNAAFGGFGGPKFVSPKLAFPDREPDIVATDFMPENLACIYRLVGDTYRVHVDYDYAKGYGYEQPFMMGLCTYGFGVRLITQAVIPYEPERITHLYAQIRNVCYPGRNITVQGWKVEEGKIYWKMLDEQGRLLMANGIYEYK